MIIRTLLLPVRATLGVGKLSAKSGYKAGRLSAVSTYRVGRAVGLRRLALLAVGVGVGLMLAPSSGEELRQSLRRRWAGRRSPAGDDAVAERVRYELSHSPRTWHLPQPSVEVVAGTAILTGGAPHTTGKSDLERAAATVPGVVGVESRLVVAAPNDGHG